MSYSIYYTYTVEYTVVYNIHILQYILYIYQFVLFTMYDLYYNHTTALTLHILQYILYNYTVLCTTVQTILILQNILQYAGEEGGPPTLVSQNPVENTSTVHTGGFQTGLQGPADSPHFSSNPTHNTQGQSKKYGQSGGL